MLKTNAWYRVPGVQAFLFQCAAFVAALPIFVLVSNTISDLPAISLVILQGVLAASLAWWRKLAPWWLFIQFFFPIALWLASGFHFPPEIFLAAFGLLVALYWTTFRTQVPFYPSQPTVWASVSGLLPKERSISMIDIGSGLGGLIGYLAAHYAKSDFTGIEVAPLPWLISRITRQTNNCNFIRGDYNRLDFSSYDVVFAYLSNAAMPALWEKASTEMRLGTLLISYEFAIPDVAPDFILNIESRNELLYGWHM